MYRILSKHPKRPFLMKCFLDVCMYVYMYVYYIIYIEANGKYARRKVV